MAIQAGAVYTVNASGQPRVYMLSAFELEKLVRLETEGCADLCKAAAISWNEHDHRRVATILANNILGRGKA